MAACYVLNNRRDSSILITGTTVSSPCRTTQPSYVTGSHGSATRNTRSAVHGHNVDRYVPVLAVRRPSVATTVTAPIPNRKGIAEGAPVANGSQAGAFGRPVASVDCFQSRTPIAQKVRNCSTLLSRPHTDLRTGFMRTMSKPTPGELDLKLHQDKHALDKLKADLRREQAAIHDPDKLEMKDILKLYEEKKNAPTYPIRPRAAKRRVAHASLVSGPEYVNKPEKSERDETREREMRTQKAISEYKHRLHVLTAQMRANKLRAQSASSLHSQGSSASDPVQQSLRLAPSYKDRYVSIQLYKTGGPTRMVPYHESLDAFRLRSYRLQSRESPRESAVSNIKGLTAAQQPIYPNPIYIPSGQHEGDVNGGSDDENAQVKLSMRSASHITRENSYMSDIDPQNHRRVLPVYTCPRPTIPPANSPVSELESDDEQGIDDCVFDDKASLRTNWSRSRSRMSIDSSESPRHTESVTSRSNSRSSKTEMDMDTDAPNVTAD